MAIIRHKARKKGISFPFKVSKSGILKGYRRYKLFRNLLILSSLSNAIMVAFLFYPEESRILIELVKEQLKILWSSETMHIIRAYIDAFNIASIFD